MPASADCKSAGFALCRFKSCLPHHQSHAGMAKKQADAPRSDRGGRKLVWVQVPLPAPRGSSLQQSPRLQIEEASAHTRPAPPFHVLRKGHPASVPGAWLLPRWTRKGSVGSTPTLSTNVFADLAHLVERRVEGAGVPGSTPGVSTMEDVRSSAKRAGPENQWSQRPQGGTP